MEAKDFEREDRYAVIKYKKLTDQQWTLVPTMLQNFEGSRVECVVIESDWPEYNFVWLMLEHRMAGFPVPDFNAVKCTADVAIAEQRLADAERRNVDTEKELFNLKHAVWHALDDSGDTQDFGAVAIMESDFKKLCELVPEDWHEAALNTKPEAADLYACFDGGKCGNGGYCDACPHTEPEEAKS